MHVEDRVGVGSRVGPLLLAADVVGGPGECPAELSGPQALAAGFTPPVPTAPPGAGRVSPPPGREASGEEGVERVRRVPGRGERGEAQPSQVYLSLGHSAPHHRLAAQTITTA